MTASPRERLSSGAASCDRDESADAQARRGEPNVWLRYASRKPRHLLCFLPQASSRATTSDCLPALAAGNLATDAHRAALSLERGACLYSCDADLSRFPGVRWTDPLRR